MRKACLHFVRVPDGGRPMPEWQFKQHTTKKGQKIWYGRSYQPVRGEDGEIRYRQVERSTGTASIAEARQRAREFDLQYAEVASRPVPQQSAVSRELTFADCVGTYIKSGNGGQFLEPIVCVIGLKLAKDINQDDCLDVVALVYPNAKPSTTNRQVWTPISAVLRFCGFTPNLKRPKGHDKLPTIDRTAIPPENWIMAVLPHLSPKLRALMLLINLHGLRISEALRRTPADVDPRRWTLTLPDTKGGVPAMIKLSDPVIEALKEYDWRAGNWLFGTCLRWNVNRDLKKACDKAGVQRYGTHRIGRHSFATRLLEDGKSLPYLKKAGRWSTLKAVERYSHLAKSEVDDEVREMAKRWHEGRQQSEVVPIGKKRTSG